jgi:hypothetical protein
MNPRIGALVLAFALSIAQPARAEGPAATRIVVVEVDPAATEIDAATLREAIGKELGASAVAPDDAPASQAGGRITVSVDRGGHALVVSYREAAAPITRSIDLPGDPSETTREAVLLAGNLARDEAGELVAALRKSTPAPQATSEPTPAPAGRIDEDTAKLDRLGATLESHARGYGLRTGLMWALQGVGLAIEGVGLGLSFTGHDAGLVLVEGGVGLVLAGSLVAPPNFDNLVQYYAHARAIGLPPDLARQDVEQAWLRVAHFEHRSRRIVGWSAIVLGSISAGWSTWFLVASQPPSASTRSAVPVAAGSLAVDAVGLALGVTLVTTEGPVESALHDYEGAAGHEVVQGVATAIGPRVWATPGGAVAGVGGRF